MSNISVEYRDTSVECPFCSESLLFRATVEIENPYIRQTSSDSFNKYFSVDLDGKITKIHVNHECTGPKEQGA